MLNFRNLIVSIAGLWTLCLIQNQIHPHRYIDYSNYTSELQAVQGATLKAAPADTASNAGPAPALDFSAFALPSSNPLFVPAQSTLRDTACFQNVKFAINYRIFLTGLSPPTLSST